MRKKFFFRPHRAAVLLGLFFALSLLKAPDALGQPEKTYQGPSSQLTAASAGSNLQYHKGGMYEGFRPEQEIIEKRNRTTKHFRNSNGSVTVQVGAVKHYQDANGRWQDIDPAIVTSDGANGGYKNVTSEIKSYFPAHPGSGDVSMELGGITFTWWQKPSLNMTDHLGNIVKTLPANINAQGRLENGVLKYEDVYPGITEEFVSLPNGLENNTIIDHLSGEMASLPAPSNIVFRQFIPLGKGGRVLNHNKPQSEDFESSEFQISIPELQQNQVNFGAIVVFDKGVSREEAMLIHAPADKLTAEQQQRLRQSVYTCTYAVRFADDGIEVSAILPASWLQDSKRMFPVVIDPVVTITPSGASSTFYGPMTHWYGYQRHADLYLQSEIGNYGSITAIEYNSTTNGTAGNKPTKVYMRTTTATTLSGTNAWNSATYTGTGATLCLDANTNQGNTTGWKMLTLTTPFPYTQDNLLVMVSDMWGGSGSTKYYNISSSVTGRQAYKRQDNSDPGDGTATAVEDYLPEIRITYDFLNPCTGQPTAGTTVAATTSFICSGSTALSLNGSTSAGSLTYQWQSSTNGGTTWSNFGTPTQALTSPVITQTTMFRCVVTCTPSGLSDNSAPVTVTVNAPTAGTTTGPPTICAGSAAQLSLTGATGSGVTYQWQSSPNNVTYTDVPTGGTSATYSATPLAATYYRCMLTCSGGTLQSSSTPLQVQVNPTPSISGTTPGSRCGIGTVDLAATSNTGGATIKWYSAQTGGAPIGTGSPFTTPFLTGTTTFYVAAAAGGGSGVATLGAGALTSVSGTPDFSGVSPFAYHYGNYKHQYLIRASELNALGVNAGSISSLAFDVASVVAGTNFNNFQISFKETSATAMTATFETNMTPVYSAAFVTPTVGINTYNFPLPFTWNGSSNIVVQVCWNNNNSGVVASSAEVKYDNTAFISNATHRLDGTQNNMCSEPNATNTAGDGPLTTKRPKMIFNYNSGCESGRTAVTATINPAPALSIAAPQVVCSDAVRKISVSSPLANYTNYVWAPQTGLFTDPAGTAPYTGGNASSVYFKSGTAGAQTFSLLATNNTGAQCAASDTVRIHTQPGNISITGQPDTICVSGTTTLSLAPGAGYFPGSIRWQSSGNGGTYTDINGATNTNYTTPTLTYGNNTYFRALVKDDTGVCQSPVKYVVIANPSVISAPDSFHCGPGPVTLSVTTGGNGSAVWYENASGGLPVASGSPFVTPNLSTTRSYWVSAGGGGSAGSQTIGAGASTSSDYVSPFYHFYGGQKNQYLIRASELIAAGVPPGANITSIAFDVVTSGYTYNSFAMSVGSTTANALNNTWQTPVTQVRAPANYTTTPGINTITFNAPYPWNGTSNLVIQTCYSNNNSGGTSNTVRFDNTSFVSTAYQRTDDVTPATMCANTTTNNTYSKRPKFIVSYDNRCESPRVEVTAYIHPKPDVDLGPDINRCIDAGTAVVLDAGVQPNQPSFSWSNGAVSQVTAVNASGTYNVVVENEFLCKGYDTIKVLLRKNPEVDLGNDTSVCNGVVLTLDPGNDGTSYFWNTGEQTQTIDVNAAGSYHVLVTNNESCATLDTINVAMQGELPKIRGIQISNNGAYTFQFTATYPENVIGYEWDFGDGSEHSFLQSPTHTYPDAGDYLTTLRLSSTCGFTDDSITTHIVVGIHELNVDDRELSVYPNPSKGQATILNKGNLKMERIAIYNVLGQQIYTAGADSKDRHTLDLSGLASGIYTIQIATDKGYVARKLEIIK